MYVRMYVGIHVCMTPWPRGRRTWAGKGVQEERRVGKRPGRCLVLVLPPAAAGAMLLQLRPLPLLLQLQLQHATATAAAPTPAAPARAPAA